MAEFVVQLVAYRENGSLILAHQAVKGVDYECLECKGVVRRRGGIHRRNHFYHIAKSSQCRLNGKSMNHLQVQWAIQQSLPQGECVMEKRFPKINRIADVCWERERIVFEVQCSAISKEELLARNHDYESMGYDVVWILHDQRYNKRRMTGAEGILQESTFYYTNIDINGEGAIYDQLSITGQGLRLRRFTRFPVDLSVPQRKREDRESKFVVCKKKLFFSGDTMDRILKGQIERCDLEMFFGDAQQDKLNGMLLLYLQRLQGFVVRFYQQLFRFILEKSCQ